MNLARRHLSNRPGVTLIELLVVISILLMLAVVALPQVQPMMETRKVREGARSINVFFGAVRTQAIQSRRPCGVILHRSPNNPNAVTTLQMVEIPPNYSGSVANATLTLTLNGIAGGYANLTATIPADTIVPRTIRSGDLVQVNHQGPWYMVASDGEGGVIDDTTGYVTVSPGTEVQFPLTIRLMPGTSLPWTQGTPSGPLPFSVARQPYDDASGSLNVRRSGNTSLTLPVGMAIDLGVSGLESYPGHFWESNLAQDAAVTKGRPVIITFSPTGAVDRVTSVTTITAAAANPDSRTFSPIEPIYLLIGRVSQVSMPEALPLPNPVPNGWKPAGDAIPNWLDPASLWISLMPRTGLVSVAENASIDIPEQDATFKWDDRTTWIASISAVRKFARTVQTNLGGR